MKMSVVASLIDLSAAVGDGFGPNIVPIPYVIYDMTRSPFYPFLMMSFVSVS